MSFLFFRSLRCSNPHASFLIAVFFTWLSTLTCSHATGQISVNQSGDENHHRFTREHVLGTNLDVRIIAANDQDAQDAFTQSMAELERLEAIFSIYRPDSECSQLSATTRNTPTQLSPELFNALRIGNAARTLSKGGFTHFSGAFEKIWKESAKAQSLPTPERLLSISELISSAEKQIKLDPQNSTITLGPETQGLTLNLNAFAKGIIIDSCLKKIINSRGVHSALVNIGGDIASGGKPHNWPVSITPPLPSLKHENLTLSNQSIATSGHYHRFVRIGEKTYSHIIKATSGQPATEVLSATVVAPSAAEADMLATLMCLGDVTTGLRIIHERKKCHALLIDKNQQCHYSPDWPESQDFSTDEEHHVRISFEQAFSTKGKKSDRHYTVVWVENEHSEKVKDILLWHKMKKRKYLKTLKTWWSKGGKKDAKNYEYLKNLSEATKKAGQYSVIWDHTDDQNNLLLPGKYTIHLEVNREDGPEKESPTHVQISIDTRQTEFSKKSDAKDEIRNFHVER